MDGYPFTCPIQVRWRDLDANGHVNNAVFVTFLEVSRAELWHNYFSFDHVTEFPFVLARVTINYRGQIHLEDEVLVGVRVGRVGRSSFTFDYRIEANGELAAEGETVQVHIERKTGKPVPLPSDMRSVIEQLIH